MRTIFLVLKSIQWISLHPPLTIKKAECQRIDAFEMWCWKRLMRVPWTARRSNPSILKEISPEYSLGRLVLSWISNTLATWYKEGKTLMLGNIEGKRKKMTEDEMVGWHHWLNGHESEQTQGDNEGQGSLACCSPWGRRVEHDYNKYNPLAPHPVSLWYCCSHAFRGNKLTQKDNADSGVQFITPVGPRQSLLLAKDPDQFLSKPYIP